MSPSRPAPSEIELKLGVPADRLDSIIAFAVAHGGAPRAQHATTTYWDTAEFALARAGYALRVRQLAGQCIQTLKRRRSGSGLLAERAEWEWPVSEEKPDVALVAAAGGAEVPPLDVLRSVRPVFTTEIERTAIELHQADGTRIELAADRGRIAAGGGSVPVSEVELELKSPEDGKASLFSVALALQSREPISILPESKAEIGYRLAGLDRPEATKAGSVPLSPELPVGDAYRLVVASCLDHLIRNHAAFLAGVEVDAIHQMRVASRRLRAAIGLFGKVLRSHETSWLEAELQWLAGELGRARDWDVFASDTLRRLRAGRGAADAAESARADARARAAAALASPRYTTLLLTAGLWCEKHLSGGAPIVELAPRLLAKRAKKLRKTGRHLRRLSAEERHSFRKSAKKLRYGAGFLAPLFPGGRAERYQNALSRLQDQLGEVNDLQVARQLAAELGEEVLDALEPAIAKRERACLARLPRAWKTLREKPAFWE